MTGDQQLGDSVRRVMAETFDIDESEIPIDVRQETFSPWTSLAHVTLALALESEFGVTFAMDEIAEMTSLERIVERLR